MKVLKKANLVRIVILAAMAVLVCPNAILAKEELVNPSFETGDLLGWDTHLDAINPDGGEINVRESHTSDLSMLYSPIDGRYFALLKADGPWTTLSQRFDASVGDEISGWAFFDAQEWFLFWYNDKAHVQIIDSGGAVVAVPFIASVDTVNPVGPEGETPWTYWKHIFTEPGTYTVEARVANGGDIHWDSYMGLDAVVLTVQEPKEPKVMKQDIIDQLGMYAHLSKRIRKAIREIEKSLEDKLWTDNSHLKSKGGKKVFDHESHAARELDHLLKGIPDDGKCGGISFIELKYTDSLPIYVEVYLKNVPLGSFHVEKGDTFVVEATDETGGKLHPEIKLVSNGIELTKIHTSCSKPINIGDEHGDFIIVDLEKLPPKSGKKGKKHQISEEVQDAVEAIEQLVEQLVEVDWLLAEKQLNDAIQLTPDDDDARLDKFNREIAKAEKELAKGDEDRDDYKLGRAIHHYKKAWEHATHAIKEATKLPKS